MKLIQRHIELVASGTSLLLVWLAAVHLTAPGGGRWRATAIVALACGALSALAVWLVRRQRGEARQAALLRAQGILHDIVSQQRRISAVLPRLPTPERLEIEGACVEIARAVTRASDTLQQISDDAARDWRARYADYRIDAGPLPRDQPEKSTE